MVNTNIGQRFAGSDVTSSAALSLSSIYFDTKTNTEAFVAAGECSQVASVSLSASFNDTHIKVFTLSEGVLTCWWSGVSPVRRAKAGSYWPILGPCHPRTPWWGLIGFVGLSGRGLPVNFPVKKSSGLSDGVWMHLVQVRRLARNISSSEQWVCVWWHSQNLPVLWLCRISFSKPTSYCWVTPPADMKVFSSLSH